MSALEDYAYREIEFTKDGTQVDPAQAAAVGVLANQVDELIVLSHGWNNNMDDARSLYDNIAASFTVIRSAPQMPALASRTIGLVGVLWPSKRFTDAELIPGGAAGVGATDPNLAGDLVAMSDAFDRPHAKQTLQKAAALVPALEHSQAAQREYADLLRSLISKQPAEPADAVDQFFHLDGDDLLARLDAAAVDAEDAEDLEDTEDRPGDGRGGVQAIPMGGAFLGDDGAAAGLPFGLDTLWSKGRNLLNFVTYYEMKARAGTIGSTALAPVLTDNVIGQRARLHLVGHSFGARLVTAAADAMAQAGSVSSLNLLQAAFSHNAFAQQWKSGRDGGFRQMITSRDVAGPVIVTHTRNDTAVGLAYAMASRIAGQNDSAIGDKDSPYGGLGSNGAQHTPEARDDQDLGDERTVYTFQTGVVHNLLADKYVSGHSDIAGVQVANAVLQSVATGL